MYDPANANFIFWWLLYNDGEKVKVRNHLLFLNSLSEPLRPERPYSSIPEYDKKGEERETISEWSVSLADIRSFLISQ